MNSRAKNIISCIIAVIVYLCIDLLYVFLAKNRYETVVKSIQKGDQMELDVGAAIICYAFLAFGWYFIAVALALSYVDKLKQRSPSWNPLARSALSGLVAGLLYGLVVFGVFNLTMRTLFSSRYSLSLMLQDIVWGSLFNMVFTCVYMITWYRFTDPTDL